MAEELADLRVRVSAETRRFDQGLQRSERTVNRFANNVQSRISRLGRNLGGALAAFATVQGFRRLARGIDTAVDSLDNIAKTADSIGLTTDALQELRVAADLSGVATDKFDTTMRRFARTASDAKNGLSTAVRAFEAVDVEVTNADGSLKDLDVLLGEVADGMSGMTDATQRAATAQELFGRGGTEMVNLLAKGSDEIERMRQQARELGIVFDEDLIRRSVQVKDEMNLMNRQISAASTVMLAELAPALRDITGFLADVAWAAGLAWRGMRRLAGAQLDAIEVPRLTEDLEQARAQLEAFDASFAQRIEDFGENLSGDQLNAVLEREADRRQAIVERIDQLTQDLSTALGGGEDVVPPDLPGRPPLDLGGGGGGGGSLSAEATAERESALQREIRTLAERTNELTRMAEAQASLDPAMEGYTVALRAAEVEAKLLARAEAENVEVTGELAERIREVARAYAEAEAASGALREEQENLDQGSRIFEEMARGLEGATGQAKSFEEALKNVAMQLAHIAVQGLKQPGGGILGSLFSGAGGLAGIFGGGGGGPSSSAVSAALRGGGGLFDSGGPTGGRRGQVAGIVHGEEFVVKAGPAQQHRDLLEAINSGRLPRGFQEGGMVPRMPGISPPSLGGVPRGRGGGASVQVSQSFDFRGANVSEAQFRRIAQESKAELMREIQQERRLDGSFLGTA